MNKDLISMIGASPKISGEKLARNLGISRQALHKQIMTLRKSGYKIKGQPRAGYQLISEPDRMMTSKVLSGLKTRNFGRNLVLLEKVSSTQKEAKVLADKGLPEGTTVLAETQTHGVGRLGRPWESGEGGLWFSMILKPHLRPQQASLLALTASVAVAHAIETVTKIPCYLKWPNDVFIEAKPKTFRKVSGSLVDLSAEADLIRWAVLGIGIDVNNSLPNNLEKIGISLYKVAGHPINRLKLFQSVLENLEKSCTTLIKSGFGKIMKEVVARSLIKKGKMIQLNDSSQKITGKFIKFKEDGSILLNRTNGKQENFFAGDVTILN